MLLNLVCVVLSALCVVCKLRGEPGNDPHVYDWYVVVNSLNDDKSGLFLFGRGLFLFARGLL